MRRPHLHSGVSILLLALALGLALRAPGWFSDDEKRRFLLFEPDEIQHVDIAFDLYQQLSGDSLDHYFTPIFNVRGYGGLSGQLLYFRHLIDGGTPDVSGTILLNRVLSTFFSLLLIWVVYLIGRRVGFKESTAGLAALLLACCDLNCTYAHYGIPAMGYVLGLYLTILGLVSWEKNNRDKSAFFFLVLGTAMAFGFKFDFLALFVVGGYLLYKVITTLSSQKREPLLALILGLPVFLVLVGSLTAFSWSPLEMLDSWRELQRQNQDVIAQDNHWLTNPIVYAFATVAGFGALVSFAASTAILRIPEVLRKASPAIFACGVLLALECLLRWSIDTPFVRRANFLMPILALVAAYGIERAKWKSWQVVVLVIYTLGFALAGQSNHWFDSRSKARDWLATEIPATSILAATPYAPARDSRPYVNFKINGDWEYALLHESYYARYWRSMTTPFGPPKCCEEVYHCQGEKMCNGLQAILSGQRQDIELVARFTTHRFFPERWLYHRILGPYDTFYGDALVYRKK
ncbi:hypothetical protein CEQ90_07465 [Lewinellaceae bacterium SD302]|nr:hypothetical protein CEQ90_07465 [Lewinellaceae bacterium SD302]